VQDRTLRCWGGDQEPRPRPERVVDAGDFDALAVGTGHACGVRAGELSCWGTNVAGTLGVGSTQAALARSEKPLSVGGHRDFVALGAGFDHACAIRSGQLLCWGHNGASIAGPSAAAREVTTPTRVGTARGWTAVDLFKESACGIRDGALYCWGSNDDARLGQGIDSHTLKFSPEPLRVGDAADWTAIAVGDFFVCGLRKGALYCWGASNSGQLGMGDFVLLKAPKRVGNDNDWTAIAAGEEHTCGLRKGALYCWGRDYDGQLGIGPAKDPERCGGGNLPVCNRPVRVGNESDWTAIALGAFHSCGLRDERLYCWGRNDRGQLGLGDVRSRDLPTEVR